MNRCHSYVFVGVFLYAFDLQSLWSILPIVVLLFILCLLFNSLSLRGTIRYIILGPVWFLLLLVRWLIMLAFERLSIPTPNSCCLHVYTDQLCVRWSISSAPSLLRAWHSPPTVVHPPPHRLHTHVRVSLSHTANLRVAARELRGWHVEGGSSESAPGLYYFHSDSHQNSILEREFLAVTKGNVDHHHFW